MKSIILSLILILTAVYPLSKKKLAPMNEELMKRRGERMQAADDAAAAES